MVFVDASALIALVAREADAIELAERLEAASPRLCSAISVWEAVAGLCRSYRFLVPEAQASVKALMAALDIQISDIGERECDLAIGAYERFGKGRHPAALNLGDCFAYACAVANAASLLFKGADFSRTDVPAC